MTVGRWRIGAVVVGLALFTAACGDDDGGEGAVVSSEVPDILAGALLTSQGDQFVGLGASDDEGIVLLRSDDATTWDTVGDVTGLDVSEDRLVASFAAQPDGASVLVGQAFDGDESSPLVFVSPDGVEWDEVSSDGLDGLRGLDAVVSDGEGFVAAATSQEFTPVLLRSRDGADWEPVETSGLEVSDGSESVRRLAVDGAGRFVAFGFTECDECADDDVAVGWRSDDGVVWEEIELGDLADALDEANTDLLPEVVGLDRGFSAVAVPTQTEPVPTVWSSTDGASWSDEGTVELGSSTDVALTALVADGGGALAVFVVDDEPELRRLPP